MPGTDLTADDDLTIAASIETTDVAGNTGTGSDTQVYTVDVTAPAPTVTLDNVTADNIINAAEEGGNIAITGTLGGDAAAGDTVTLTLVDGTTTTTYTGTTTNGTTFSINVPGTDLTADDDLTIAASIETTDVAGNTGTGSDTQVYTVDVTAPAPTVTLDNVTADNIINAAEEGGNIAITGTLGGDAAAGDTVTLTLVDGTTTTTYTGTTTNGTTFSINVPGTDLTADDDLTIAASIETTDVAGNTGTGSDTQVYTVDVTAPAPTVTLDNVTADNIINAAEEGGNIAITGTLGGDAAAGDTVTLTLVDGTTTTTYTGTTTNGTTFSINVPGTDLTADDDLTIAASIETTDVAGNTGTGSDTQVYTVDIGAPTVAITLADSTITVGETTTVTFTFSTAVQNFDTSDVTVGNGAITVPTTSDGGTTWTATYTPTADIEAATNVISVGAGYEDLSGNTGTAGSSANYVVDTKPPTLDINAGSTSLSSGASTLVTFTFSEPVTNFDSSDVTITGGSIGAVTTSDGGTTWTGTLTADNELDNVAGSVSVGATFTDILLNTGTGDTLPVNVIGPAPVLDITAGSTSLNPGDSTTLTFSFSEDVEDFVIGDISVTGGTITGLTTTNSVTYTATFTAATVTDDVAGNVSVLGTSYSDDDINTGNDDDLDISVEAPAPTLTITADSTNLNSGETTTLTFTFSENVNGFTSGDISVTGGAVTGLTTTNSTTFTATFTADVTSDDETANVSVLGVSYTDDDANTGNDDDLDINVEGPAPTVTITAGSTTLSSGASTLVTFTFSENVTNFDQTDVTVAGGSITNPATSDGGITWTATLTAVTTLDDVAGSISVGTDYEDDDANAGTGDTLAVAVEGPSPTVSISAGSTSLDPSDTTTLTFTFSENVTNFDQTDVTVVGGSITNPATSDGGVTWTATLTADSTLDDIAGSVSVGTAYEDDDTNAGSTDSLAFTIVGPDPAFPDQSHDYQENRSAGATVATLTSSADTTGFKFSVSDSAVSADGFYQVNNAGVVTITATGVAAGANNDFETAPNSFDYDIVAIDADTNETTATVTLNVTDIDDNLPTLSITSSDTTLLDGETATITFTFSEAVLGFDATDISVTGGVVSGLTTTDSITWTATFTPTDPLEGAGSVSVADDSYTDVDTNNGLGDTLNLTIDTIEPSVAITLADTTLTVGETTAVTFTFTEAVQNFDGTDVTVGNGSISAPTTSDGGITWTATYTPTADIEDATNVISVGTDYQDLPGNDGLAGSSANYVVDTLAPTVGIALADTTLTVGETTTVTFTFSEAVQNFDASDVTVDNGAITGPTTADGGITWTATYTPMADVEDTTNVISVGTAYEDLNDNQGNPGASANYIVDTRAPTVTISMTDSTISVGDNSIVTFTFSEAVQNFDETDVTVENGSISTPTTSDGGITWLSVFTPTVDTEDLTNVISVGTAYQDLNGNDGTPGVSANYIVDTLAPSVTITLADSTLTIGETTTVTFTFNEVVQNFELTDIASESGVVSNLTTTDNITYTAKFTPTADLEDSTNVVTVGTGYQDVYNNPGGAGASANYVVDTLAPNVAITLADSTLTAGETTTVTFTFSEAVQNFDSSDVSVESGAISGLTTIDNITWTATFTPTTPLEDTSNVISIAAASYDDLNSNPGNPGISANYVVDTIEPVFADQTHQYNENRAAGAVVANLTATDANSFFFNATSSNTSTDGFFQVDNTGAVTITAAGVAAGVAQNDFETGANSFNYDIVAEDVSGNQVTATVTLEVLDIDDGTPTLTITSSDGSLTEGDTATITFTFSEAVTGFTDGDIAVSGGTLGLISTSDGGVTFTATFTPTASFEGTANISVADDTYTDLSANNGTGDDLDLLVDTSAPVPTLTLDPSITPDDIVNADESASTIAVTGFVGGDAQQGDTVTLTVNGVQTTGIVQPDLTFSINVAGSDLAADPDLIIDGTVETTDALGNSASADDTESYSIETGLPVFADQSLDYDENRTAGDVVGQVVASDNIAVVSFTFATTGTSTSADNLYQVDASGNISITAAGVASAANNDFETAPNSFDYDVVAADAAGNESTATITLVVNDVDESRPSLVISSSDTLISDGETALITFTFSEEVTGFSDSDISVSEGALGAISTADNITFTATYTPTDPFDGTVTISVADDTYTDLDTINGTGDSIDLDVDTIEVAITSADAVTVPEGYGTTATVLQVLSDDPSATLSITGGDDAGRFLIDGTGKLTFVEDPDFDAPVDANTDNVYSIIVTADDGGGNTDTQTITVTVTNLDETGPTFTSGTTAVAVVENTGADQVIYDADATDPVSDGPSNPITYSLGASGGDEGAFTIDASTGEITLIADPDFEGQSSYSFEVIATDSVGNATSQTVNLAVLNADEVAPVFTSSLTASPIAENSGAGQGVYTAAATDPVTDGPSDPVTYALGSAGGDEGAFSIDTSTGVVTLTADPNFEAQDSYSFEIVATDDAGNTSVQTVTLAITNVDENAPTFTNDTFSYPENRSTGAAVATITTASDDVGVTGYSFAATGDETSGDGYYEISNAGVITLTAAGAAAEANDFDTGANSFDHIVVAADAIGNTSTATITLNVTNVDETGPTFTSGTAATAIVENTGAAQIIYDADATDTSTPVTYALGSTGGDEGAFTIDANTGEVTLTADPDFEGQNAYSFEVIAADAAGNTTSQTVSLAVVNEDEVAPVFTSGLTAPPIAENSGAAQDIYTAVASDPLTDGPSNPVTYALGSAGGDEGVFTIDTNSGVVTLAGDPDFETQDSYSFEIVASDAAGNTSAQTVTLAITNVDENAPIFTDEAFNYDENQLAGATVATITTATDDVAVTSYSFTGSATTSADGYFEINNSGVITLTAAGAAAEANDFEAGLNSFAHIVVASDAVGNTTTATVTLNVLNLDETGPAFTSSTSATAVVENTGAAQVIYDADATDPATDGPSDPVTYTLGSAGGDEGAFTIDASTGEVTLTADPDFEGQNAYSFEVIASDAAGR